MNKNMQYVSPYHYLFNKALSQNAEAAVTQDHCGGIVPNFYLGL